MSKNTYQMNRRTMLKAAGISLALPWMESLAGPRTKSPPRRFCSIYFPYGVSLPKQDGEYGRAAEIVLRLLFQDEGYPGRRRRGSVD